MWKTVVFLDVESSILENGEIKTTMYVKPTDSKRYLNRKSFHSTHTFKSLPFSQFRRAAVICSDVDDRLNNIERMISKFLDSGYHKKYLIEAKAKAMELDRGELFQQKCRTERSSSKVITFVANYDPWFRRELKSFFKEYDSDMKKLIGDYRLVIAEKRQQYQFIVI